MELKELYKQKDSILENFDFHKVQDLMIVHNWTWAFDNEQRVPTINELYGMANDLTYMAIQSEDAATCIRSGGLAAYKLPWGLSLAFEFVHKSGY